MLSVIVSLFLLGALIVFQPFVKEPKTAPPAASSVAFTTATKAEDFYLPSPLEGQVLEQGIAARKFWDLKATDLPDFYSELHNNNKTSLLGLSNYEVHRARYWSILAASLHWGRLRADLQGADSSSCALLNQERLFRKQQLLEVGPERQKLRRRLGQCSPSSLVVLWFQVEDALRKGDSQGLQKLEGRFREAAQGDPSRWSTHFASKLGLYARTMGSTMRGTYGRERSPEKSR